MKILWHSNAPWAPTGYGNQTGLFAPHVAKHYDLAISSFYGLEGGRLVWDGIPVLPGTAPDFGNAFLLLHANEHFGAPRDGLVLTLLDVWVLSTEMVSKLNLAAWVPVDHEPCPPEVIRFFKESGSVPIAMSRFGEQQLKDVGLDPLYCPHAVDTNIFRPYPKQKVREEFGVSQDTFLVGMVAANKGRPSRKGFQQAMEAFAIFRQKHSEAILYLYTIADPNIANGEDILSMARALGIQDSIAVPPRYQMLYNPLPSGAMAKIYSTFDVLLNPSMGEGFGVPILEAAACGVPSIVTNFSSMPEVAGPAGWRVDFRKYWTPGNSWQAVADVPAIVNALEECHGLSDEERQHLSMAARNHALDYDVKRVMKKYMLPALEEVQERFEERQPLEPVAA